MVASPLVDNEPLLIAPDVIILPDAEISPVAVIDAAFTNPVTLILSTTSAPTTVAEVADDPMEMVLAVLPMRIRPFEAPVPDSSTRSPPKLLVVALPAA